VRRAARRAQPHAPRQGLRARRAPLTAGTPRARLQQGRVVRAARGDAAGAAAHELQAPGGQGQRCQRDLLRRKAHDPRAHEVCCLGVCVGAVCAWFGGPVGLVCVCVCDSSVLGHQQRAAQFEAVAGRLPMPAAVKSSARATARVLYFRRQTRSWRRLVQSRTCLARISSHIALSLRGHPITSSLWTPQSHLLIFMGTPESHLTATTSAFLTTPPPTTTTRTDHRPQGLSLAWRWTTRSCS
jgi:hypothetical protein